MSFSSGFWWGIILIGLGSLFLLDNLEVVEFGYLAGRLWPVLLILWGLSLLFKKRRDSPSDHDSSKSKTTGFMGDTDTTTGTDRIGYSSVFGDLKVRATSPQFKGGTASTVFGDTDLDMRSASLADGEQVLTVSGVFGDANITLPKDTAFSLRCNTVLGRVECNEQRRDGFSPDLRYESPEFASAPRRLRLEVTQVIGDVCVRS